MNIGRVRFSIITICRNEEKNIERTIQSVINQKFTDYEYIIVDGASTDNTVKIINQYRKTIEELGISFCFISEPDKGIYDAMNKAVRLANGIWSVFINAGDELLNEYTLSRVAEEISEKDTVFYGNVLFYDEGYYKRMVAGDIHKINWENPIFHQGAFTKTVQLKNLNFDLKYKIVSDYDLFLKIYIAGECFKKSNLIIAVFRMDGLSTNNARKCNIEMSESRKEKGVRCPYFSWYLVMKAVIINSLRKILKRIMGKYFFSMRRGWKDNKEFFEN